MHSDHKADAQYQDRVKTQHLIVDLNAQNSKVGQHIYSVYEPHEYKTIDSIYDKTECMYTLQHAECHVSSSSSPFCRGSTLKFLSCD